MSTHTPPSPDIERPRTEPNGADVRAAAARVAEWLTSAPDSDPPAEPEALDTRPRRWDVVNPSATRIGHPEDPANDLPERLRAIHAERDADVQGNEERRRRLDVARVTQAVCNSLDLTAWERDRVLGVVCELDPATFERERTVPRVALVVARRVVDAERRAWLGLDDPEWLGERPPERIEELSERRHRLTDDERYERLRSEVDLASAAVDHVETTLARELEGETIERAAFGRSPRHDPFLPPFERRVSPPEEPRGGR